MNTQSDTTLLFSIIIPIYNVEPYLKRCVDSVLAQTYTNYEIILVDDGSPDNCGQICDEYASQYDNITVVHQENKGLSAARNVGMDLAQGEYIIFIDSDDWVEPHMCESLENVIDSNPEIIVVSDLNRNDSFKPLKDAFENNSFISGLEYFKLTLQTHDISFAARKYIYNMEFLKKFNLRFKEGILYESVEFMPRVLMVAQKVAHSNRPYYHYVRRPDSITISKDYAKRAAGDLFEICQNLEQMFASYGNEILIPLNDRLIQFYMYAYCHATPEVMDKYKPNGTYVKERLSDNADKKTKTKVHLFALSPTLFKCMTNMYASIKQPIMCRKDKEK